MWKSNFQIFVCESGCLKTYWSENSTFYYICSKTNASFKLHANGRNNLQYCLVSIVGSCYVRVGSGVQAVAATPNNTGTCSALWEDSP